MARKDRVDRKHEGVTSVADNKNTTTGKMKSFRFTDLDAAALKTLTENLQSTIPSKRVSESRALRAVAHLCNDKVFIKKLAKSVVENT